MSETPDESAEECAAGDAIVTLPPVLALADCEQVFDMLSDLPPDATAVIDASNVEQMSSACVLTIVAAIKQREGITPPAAVIQPAQPFIDAFQELGMFQNMMQMEFR